MRKHIMLLTVAFIAVLAASASANTITAEPAGAITATSLGRLTLSGRGGVEISINCRTTLRGQANRTISNAREGRFGSVTEGRANECNTGSMSLLVEARNAWALQFNEAFRHERSPKLVIVNVTTVQLSVTVAGVTCLYSGTLPTSLEAEGEPVVTRLLAVLANALNKSSGSALCPSRAEVSGSFGITAQTLGGIPCAYEWESPVTIPAEPVRTAPIRLRNLGEPELEVVGRVIQERRREWFQVTAEPGCARIGARGACTLTVELLARRPAEGIAEVITPTVLCLREAGLIEIQARA